MYNQLGQVVVLTETMLQLRLQQEKEFKQQEQIETISSESLVTPVPSSSSSTSQRLVGDKCRARWSGDNQYYEAVIDSINNKESGEVTYTVTFLGYGTTEEIQEDALYPTASPTSSSTSGDGPGREKKDKEEAKKKRKVQLDEEGNIVIPKNLQINPNDSKEVRALKKKKIHAIRSTARFQKIDEEHSQRKSDWESFRNVKGKEKKTGFFTGRKQESIFKSPDNPMGKVGVTGSGKPMTEPVSFEKLKLEKASSSAASTSSSLMKLPL